MTPPVVVTKEEGKELKPFVGRDPFERSFFGNPFGLMRRFSEDMDRLFEGFGFKPKYFDRSMTEFTWTPDLEIFERGAQLVVRADLPGLTKEDVKVRIVESMLILEGERKKETEEKHEGYYRSERVYGKFYRTVELPEGIKPDLIQATFKNGVLEVMMPLAKAEKKAKTVDVKAA